MIATLFFRLKKYILYRLKAENAKKAILPFDFDLYADVIKPSLNFKIDSIEECRKLFLKNNQELELIDFKTNLPVKTSVRKVAKTSLSNRKFSAFLYHLIKSSKSEKILEAGTCLGINTQYLAATNADIITLEGAEPIATLADKNFKNKKIKLVIGNIYETFPKTVLQFSPDFIFIDADHRGTAIDFYLNEISKLNTKIKFIILHDIYWSKYMTEKWEEIIHFNKNFSTIDLYDFGVLYPVLNQEKQHFIFKF